MNISTFFKTPSVKSKQRGQGMSEYIIVVALVAVGAIGVFTAFGGTIRDQVAGMAVELSGGNSADNITAAQKRALAAGAAAARTINMGTYGQQNAAAAAATTN
jgi:hypothetical protein